MTNKKLTVVDQESPAESLSGLQSDYKSAARAKLKKYMDEELRMVRGTFQNFETPGMALDLQVRKYPGHFFKQTLRDGEECEVPLYIARHLNGIDATAEALNGKLGTCSYPIHSHMMDMNGNPIVCEGKRKRRFGFLSAEFTSSKPIETVA
jgi:hypothetical protein